MPAEMTKSGGEEAAKLYKLICNWRRACAEIDLLIKKSPELKPVAAGLVGEFPCSFKLPPVDTNNAPGQVNAK